MGDFYMRHSDTLRYISVQSMVTIDQGVTKLWPGEGNFTKNQVWGNNSGNIHVRRVIYIHDTPSPLYIQVYKI